MLLTSCWAAHTFAYEQSAYLPLLIFTGAEEDVGKSTYMKVVGRMCYRSYLLIATLSIHRVLAVYRGTFLLDESKQLAENRDMVSFINAGFDNISQHPVDSPLLPRHDMESGKLLEFDPRFPKMCAGIGTFLERDTLSRSLVIRMERYLLAESRRVKEYIYCTDEVTLPIYRAFLKFWTDERKAIFSLKCRTVIHQFPEEFRSRRRLKFVPLLAIAEMGGSSLYEEVMEAAKWMHGLPDSASDALPHRLLCDVARCYYRQILLHHFQVPDPITGKSSAVLRQPGTDLYLLPTDKLVDLLLLLPEAPWKCYGREKASLNAHRLYDLLKDYGLMPSRQNCGGKFYRGLAYKLFQEKYGRHCRVGDPTLKTVAEELAKDLGPSDGPSGGSPNPSPEKPSGGPSKFPESPENRQVGITQPSNNGPADFDKESGTSGTCDISASNAATCKVPLSLEGGTSSSKSGTLQTTDGVTLTLKVPLVPLKKSCSALSSPPPSIPAANFCTPIHPERKVGLDLETYFRWPPDGEISNQDRRRRKDGKAHVLAKDPRRNAIRLLSISTGTEVRVFDFFTETVPDDVRDLLRNSTLIIHNADFDITVLRRHGFEVSSTIFDTQLAAQLLSLGEVEPKLRKRKTVEASDPEGDFNGDAEDEETEFEKTFVRISNKYSDVVERYLGIKLEKAVNNLGGSDWSVPLTPAQLAYARDDVAHFHALETRLTEELHAVGQWENFKERSEFLVHLNQVKFAGIPVDREMLLTDKAASEELVATTKAQLREIFKDYRPLVPKSRRKKSKLKDVEANGAMFDATPQTEEINPG
jgi:hypothetical protein